MSVFDIDFDVLVKQLLPVRLRKFRTVAWMKCLAAPVRWLHELFKEFRSANMYGLAHDGQVCFLEAALNDAFDPSGRGIYISDGLYVDPVFTYVVPELKPRYVDLAAEVGAGVIATPDPLRLYIDAEVYAGVGAYTFIINVPTAVVFDLVRLKALTDKYRLPGRRYNVITY